MGEEKKCKMKNWQYCSSCFGYYYTFFIVLAANSLFLSIGISVGWPSPVLVKLATIEDNPIGKSLTSEETDLIGSIIYIGAAIGPFLFMKSAENIGRKRTLVITCLPALTGYAILVFANRVELYYLARLLIGISVGGASSVVPAYLSEIIFSAKNRGPLMAINSPAIQLGYLVSYSIGPYVRIVVFNSLIFSLLLLITLLVAYGCPESPYYTIEAKGREAAINILKELKVGNIEGELMQLKKDIKKPQNSFLDFFKSKSNLKPFAMATALLLFQQFSGIGTLLTYNEQIFLKSEGILPAEQCAIIVGVIQVISAAITTLTSRKFSRKSLLIYSLLGSGLFDFLLGTYYHFERASNEFNWVPLACLTLFVTVYNSGLDPLPWVFLGEIYPNNIKSVGSALSVSMYWLSLYILTCSFSKMNISFLFLGYAVCCICGVFYVKFEVTETKGKTLREIQESLNDSNAAAETNSGV